MVGNGNVFLVVDNHLTADTAPLCFVLPKMLGPLPHSPGPLPSSCSSAGIVLTAFSENVYTQHPPQKGISQDKEETTVGGSAKSWSEEKLILGLSSSLTPLSHTVSFSEILGTKSCSYNILEEK